MQAATADNVSSDVSAAQNAGASNAKIDSVSQPDKQLLTVCCVSPINNFRRLLITLVHPCLHYLQYFDSAAADT